MRVNVRRLIRWLNPSRPVRNAWRSYRRRARGGDYNILGLCSTGHGASLALVSSRYGVRALNLDRFVGRKYALLLAREEHTEIAEQRWPIGSLLRFLLSMQDGRLPPVATFEDCWERFFDALVAGLPLRPRDVDVVAASESHFAVNRFWLGARLSRRYFPNAAVYTGLEHHAIHRFQAFYPSGFEDAAVLTADACGEPLLRHGGAKLALTLSHADGDGFEVLAEHRFPDSSPGHLYHHFNHYLGFENGEEGKTMGLSSYGGDGCYRRLVRHLELHDDGGFRFLGEDAVSAALRDYGAARRPPGGEVLPAHADVAFAGQRLLEDVMINATRALRRRSRSRNLCFAGGVALNSVANEKCYRAGGFDTLYVMPNAGDNGHALGCALWAERRVIGRTRPELVHDFLGPPYPGDQVGTALDAAGLVAVCPDDLVDRVARLIAGGKIVGWFQGGSEYGPRALGHRSILADCRRPGIKDYLNARVKFREPFRPYAPAVLVEKAGDWFDLRGASPFMLRVVDVRPEKRAAIPGVTHVDGTARVQTVSAAATPTLHQLISAFDRLTGVPVVLNTSFNLAGRPIVEAPRDAVDCFLATAIDALVLDGHLVEKPTAR
jgi:carbamoyltransferase